MHSDFGYGNITVYQKFCCLKNLKLYFSNISDNFWTKIRTLSRCPEQKKMQSSNRGQQHIVLKVIHTCLQVICTEEGGLMGLWKNSHLNIPRSPTARFRASPTFTICSEDHDSKLQAWSVVARSPMVKMSHFSNLIESYSVIFPRAQWE